MSRLLFIYHPKFVVTLVYMLQASAYRLGDYSAWLGRTRDFRTVTRRSKLKITSKALLLLVLSYGLLVLLYGLGIWGLVTTSGPLGYVASSLAIILAPIVVALLLPIPLVIGEILIQRPREKKMVAEAKAILAKHPGKKIAIAGSFGKTTFKEMLATVLGEELHVAASPGNMNTPIGLSRFATKLDGSEDVLIFELGEEYAGDVRRLCELTQPDIGVITGISQAHLTTFGTIEAIVDTVFELKDYLGDKPVYMNGENEYVLERAKQARQYNYSRAGVGGWVVLDPDTNLDGTSFRLNGAGQTLNLNSQLLGLHQIGPLTACVDIALGLGMAIPDVEAAVALTKPFEHRMQPRQLHGATIIDDTYNGNIKGIHAGVEFLAGLSAKRKIYVTPGLVGQGDKTASIHRELGEAVGPVADVVILMRNSVTDYIREGLEKSGFKGELQIVEDPLSFYTNINYFVVDGDVVLMQNDWPDNYA